MIDYIIFGVTYGFAAAVQPGPFQTFIISQTLINGWKKTLPAAFAPLLSDGPIIILVLIILNSLPGWLILVFQTVGGLLLLYLAFNAYIAWRNYDISKEIKEGKTDRTFLNATFVNILNPNAYIGWSLIMGPLFLMGYAESPALGITLLISFYSVLVLGMAGIIILFGLAKNLGPRVTRFALGLSSIALAGFGIYQLLTGVYSLLN